MVNERRRRRSSAATFRERWSALDDALHGADPDGARRGRRAGRARWTTSARCGSTSSARCLVPRAGRGRDARAAARRRLPRRADHGLHRGRRDALAGVGVRGPLRRRDVLVARRPVEARSARSTSHCCELLGVEPDEAVFVGDGANDELAGARRVGMARDPDPPAGRGPAVARGADVGRSARHVDPRGAGGAGAMLITTMNDVPGHEITEVFGEVFGLTVRSRNIGSQIGAGLKSIIGGELKRHDEDAGDRPRGGDRQVASRRPSSKGANAMIAMRFDTSEIGGTWTEICAYGTAVQPEGVRDEAQLPTADAGAPRPDVGDRARAQSGHAARRRPRRPSRCWSCSTRRSRSYAGLTESAARSSPTSCSRSSDTARSPSPTRSRCSRSSAPAPTITAPATSRSARSTRRSRRTRRCSPARDSHRVRHRCVPTRRRRCRAACG